MSSKMLGLFFDMQEPSSPSWYFWWCDSQATAQASAKMETTAEPQTVSAQIDHETLPVLPLAHRCRATIKRINCTQSRLD